MYEILKTGCYIAFGCCDDMLPESYCDKEECGLDPKECGLWILKGTIINKKSVKTRCGNGTLYSAIKMFEEECINNGVVCKKEI